MMWSAETSPLEARVGPAVTAAAAAISPLLRAMEATARPEATAAVERLPRGRRRVDHCQ